MTETASKLSATVAEAEAEAALMTSKEPREETIERGQLQETLTQTQMETQTETQTKTPMETQTETPMEAQTETQTEPLTETQTEMQTETQPPEPLAAQRKAARQTKRAG